MLKTIKTIILFLIKLFGLIYILSFERVIGLPFIFSLLGLIWLDQTKKIFYIKPILLLILSFLIAVMYQSAWMVTIIIWFLCTVLINLGSRFIRVKKRRFVIVVIIQNLLWLWLLGIPASLVLLFQLVISYVFVIIWLKIFSKFTQR